MPIDPVHRRAALIATAVTVPLLVIAAIVIVSVAGGISSGDGGPPGPITVAAPPNIDTQAAACTKVLEKLPVQLNNLQPRVVHTKPETPFVVAWGNPAVIFRCGVDRPKALHSGSDAQFFPAGNVAGPYFDITKGDDANVWTSVDRAAYISVTIPAKYQGSDVMPPLGRAIRQALPAVCNAYDQTAPISTLCTRRDS